MCQWLHEQSDFFEHEEERQKRVLLPPLDVTDLTADPTFLVESSVISW